MESDALGPVAAPEYPGLRGVLPWKKDDSEFDFEWTRAFILARFDQNAVTAAVRCCGQTRLDLLEPQSRR